MEEKNEVGKVVFYGDSNTYGYDPADMYQQRFSEDKRWTTMVARSFEPDLEVIPEGMNGRRIPDLKYDRSYLQKVINEVGDNGLFCTMLGTNDLLMLMEPDAGYAVQKMETYLEYLCCSLRTDQILIIAPPYIGNREITDPLYQRYYQEGIRMNAEFRNLSMKHGVWFADASLWNVEMSFDLVHFSERGHWIFAEKMTRLITEILGLQR